MNKSHHSGVLPQAASCHRCSFLAVFYTQISVYPHKSTLYTPSCTLYSQKNSQHRTAFQFKIKGTQTKKKKLSDILQALGNVEFVAVVMNGCLEGQDGSLYDIDAFLQLVLLDDEGRGQSDDVTMGGLSQQPIVTETQAHLPGIII